MKTIIPMALCMVIMGACFSSWDGSGDQGNIVINLGNGGARTLVGVEEYTIILTNSGETSISKTITGGTADFSVEPGSWSILVRAMGAEVNSASNLVSQKKALKGYGEANVEVKAGATVDAFIDMNTLDQGVTEVVSAWADLKNVFDNAAAKRGAQEFVMITRNLQVNSSIEIRNGEDITLLAKDNVTITKGDVVANSLFRVIWGSRLTLSTIDQGTITINGSGDKPNNSSLFYVGTSSITSNSPPTPLTGGTLIMNDGITLTNNHATISDRGGAVVVQGGTFTMKGGTISGNTALNGGGVRVLSGTFTKEGGTIYGYTAGDSNSNTATGGKGHAVYVSDDNYRDNTLGPGNNF